MYFARDTDGSDTRNRAREVITSMRVSMRIRVSMREMRIDARGIDARIDARDAYPRIDAYPREVNHFDVRFAYPMLVSMGNHYDVRFAYPMREVSMRVSMRDAYPRIDARGNHFDAYPRIDARIRCLTTHIFAPREVHSVLNNRMNR